ncbi:hypothetical protein S7711_11570 [Stachybotrys chartarum IBT 7711]|nr:hypothetical protein S7711_11570 [Stachybotrys chartarum IBT 7711]
MSTKLL